MRYEPLVKERISSKATIGANVRIGEGTVIEDGCQIGNNVMIGHNCAIRSNVIVGDNTKIAHLVVIEENANIGSNCNICPQAHLTKDITIEDWVFLGIAVITTNDRKLQWGKPKESVVLEPPTIKCAAQVGSSAIIMSGVIIGANARIGAGAVVTKNVPAGECWFGNPAIFKRLVSDKFLN